MTGSSGEELTPSYLWKKFKQNVISALLASMEELHKEVAITFFQQ